MVPQVGAILLGLCGFYIGAFWTVPGARGVLIFGLFFFLTGCGTTKTLLDKTRPVELDDEGLTSYFAGRVYRKIPWTSVQGIVRIRRTIITQWMTNRIGYEFKIAGPDCKILITDHIEALDELLAKLDVEIRKFNIRIEAREKTDVTLKKIRSTVKDRKERRRLLREGIAEPISEIWGEAEQKWYAARPSETYPSNRHSA